VKKGILFTLLAIVVIAGSMYSYTKWFTEPEPVKLCTVEFTLQAVTPLGISSDSTVILTPERTFFVDSTEYRILEVVADSTMPFMKVIPDKEMSRPVKVVFEHLYDDGHMIALARVSSFTFLN